MKVEAIKEAIQQLPESARRELAYWFEDEFVFPGLAELDRGEGVPGEKSRAVLRDKKSLWINWRQQRRRNRKLRCPTKRQSRHRRRFI